MKNIIKKQCCKEKIRADKNGNEYIPFRTDVYFSEYNLVVYNLVDEKGLTDRVLSFEKKKTRSTRKNIAFKFIRTNPKKENYDAFYETGRIETFISEFKMKIKKKLEAIKS